MQLALTPDGGWDYPTADLISSASAVGFTAVGVNADRVDAAAVEAYAATGVRCHELLALVIGDDESVTMASAEQLADHAQTVGAEWVLTVFTAKVRRQCIRRCAKLFDDVGAAMAVEYTPLGAIPSISDGMEVVRAARRGGRAGLMIDSWHFCFSDNTWDDLAAVPLEDIAYLQFTDALEPESRDRLIRETLHRRALPGEAFSSYGVLPQRCSTAAGTALSALRCSARSFARCPSTCWSAGCTRRRRRIGSEQVGPHLFGGSIGQGCYRYFMTMIRHDYLPAGMHTTSTAALSCAGTTSANASVWTDAERRGSRQPSCFRLFSQPSAPVVGESPGRKQGPEDNSHISLSFAVCPAGNVV